LINSVIVALIVTFFSLIIGILGARALTKFKYKAKNLFNGYIAIPFVMPWSLTGIALLLFFNLIHFPLSLFTVILSHISFDVPLVTVLISSRLSKFDYSIEEASRDLGASPIHTFFSITLPIIAPSLISAAIFSFSWSFDAFYITHFVSGSQVFFPTWVYSALRYPNKLPLINAVSSVVITVELIIISIAEIIRVKDVGNSSDTLLF
ncbi:MAG: ABC transporter permease, partial [Spirochaetes bacterium]